MSGFGRPFSAAAGLGPVEPPPRKVRRRKEDKTLTVNTIVKYKAWEARLEKYIPCAKVGLDCAICTEPLDSKDGVLEQPCGHIFHTQCLDKWRLIRHNCPLCRTNVLEKDITVAYNKWRIVYSTGQKDTVSASTVKRIKPTKKPFNPLHANDFFEKEKGGFYGTGFEAL